MEERVRNGQANGQAVRRENDVIDLVDLARVLLRRWWLILLCLVIGAGGAGVVTKFFITPQYEASSMLYILTKTTTVTSLADIQLGSQLTKDFEVIALSRPVIEDAIEDIKKEAGVEYTYKELKSFLTVSNQSDTRILRLTAKHEDPEMAKIIANTMAKQTAAHMADIMSTDAPTTVERAVTPEAPVSPSLTKNCMMGGMLGAVLVIAFLVMLYMMDDSIKSEEDVEKYLGLDTLIAIPYESDMKKKKRRRRK